MFFRRERGPVDLREKRRRRLYWWPLVELADVALKWLRWWWVVALLWAIWNAEPLPPDLDDPQ